VPLSDHERRRLQQMEQALSAEDPRFASAMRRRRRPHVNPRLVIGICVLVVGLVVLVTGVAAQAIILGGIGFVIMLAGTAYAISGRRRGGPAGVVQGNGAVRQSSRKRQGGFMQRIEHRWDRRRGGGR
jgi:uncharacterized membrane protein HdeD (DUF308 family)